MIIIKKSEKLRGSKQPCSCCYSIKDVYSVTFWYGDTNSGTRVNLCKECLTELAGKIREAINED